MLKSANKIAIIDSGIGGISVLNKLIEKFKTGNYIYFADNLYMPYGNKSKEFVKKRVLGIIKYLQQNYLVDLVIVACNTASSILKDLNLKNVLVMTFARNVTYIATPLTKRNLKNINIIADSTLANEIETNILNKTKLTKIVKRHIVKYNLTSIKELCLGCTHYELVSDIFKRQCKQTNITCNSDNMLQKINIVSNELNIVYLQSKYSKYFIDLMRKITYH